MINRAEVIRKRNNLKYIIDFLSCERYSKTISRAENDRIEIQLKEARKRYDFYNNLLKTNIKKENENDRNRIIPNTKQN